MNDQITLNQFTAIQSMFDYFNKKLFNNECEPCLLNLSRLSRAHGFFAPERWTVAKEGEQPAIHEISLCPESMSRDPKQVVSTLVHEMAHLWQQDHGSPSPGYHNKQWAAKMKEVGLYPSTTAAPGGKETGKNCSHYIIEGGVFESAYDAMPKEFLYPFIYVPAEKKVRPSKNKTKYTCAKCGDNIWGKSGLIVGCMPCEQTYEEQSKD